MNNATVIEILNKIVTEGAIKPTSKGFNFRCVVCGDSKKNKRKKRGWVLLKNDGNYIYYCHNCGHSQSFQNFLKDRYPDLHHRHYKNRDVKEILSSNTRSYEVETKIIAPPSNVDDVSNEIVPYSFELLDPNVPGLIKRALQAKALRYVRNRMIPREYYVGFRVCFEGTHENRLIIPYRDSNKVMYCFQGRILSSDPDIPNKYLTINRTNVKIFQYYTADPDGIALITEGPIDAMFLQNGMATTGTISIGSDPFRLISKKFKKRIWVFDNPAMDEKGYNMAVSFIEAGEVVFVWPPSLSDCKDINDLVMNRRFNSEYISTMIKKEALSGLRARTKLKLLYGR